MQTDRVCLIQFAKRPIAGLVKTRLATVLGAEGALEAHCRLLKITFDILCKSYSDQLQLWWDEAWDSQWFIQSLESCPLERVQQGANLGERMEYALDSALRDYTKVVLVGSDCPDLSPEYLAEALALLNTEDIVLGPSDDGGFVLIGATVFVPEVLTGINWGTPSVLMHTINNLQQCGLSVGVLNTLYDVDDIADYKRWQKTPNRAV